jgi:hypothetical protein
MANWTPLREVLADVATEATFDWGDLDELVDGLPASAYQHAAFWKGARSGWPGFKTSAVQVGESVTFVRIAQSPSAAPFPSHPPAESLGAPDILLIGCVKQKLGVPAPARDLYTSPLFRKGRRYAEATGAPWFVLSAEHGLVAPGEVLAPYDRRLSKSDLEYRQAWGVRVVEQLVAAAGPLSGKSIEVHAGAAYVEPLRQHLVAAGATITEPLAGLKLGPRLAWYGRVTDPHDTPEPSAPSGPTPEVSELVARLTDESIALSPATFLATGGDGLRVPGLYSWWVDSSGALDLGRGLGTTVDPGLIYAGLAGATRSRSGRKSKNTLWGRIKTMHLGGRHEFSTFRLSLGSVLAEADGRHEIDESRLTDWMHDHLRLIPVPVSDADTLGEVETAVLTALDPPLNLDKVGRNRLRRRLSELRKQYGRKRRSATAALGD